MAEHTFQEAVARVLEDISRALARISNEQAPEAELHNLRAYLVNFLELAAADPGLEAAADDLYNAAASLVGAEELSDRAERQEMLREAYVRLDGKLPAAVPSDKARQMGLA